jgi:hypothetical protein
VLWRNSLLISGWEAVEGVSHVDGTVGLGMMLKLAWQSVMAAV